MTRIESEVRNLANARGRLVKASNDSRTTFLDATRADFDHHIVDALAKEIGQLETHALALDRILEQALRQLSD